MFHVRNAVLAALLAATPALAQEGTVPKAPVNLKEAEAQGLQRVGAEELKAFMPGINETRGPTGKSTRLFNPDGSYERKAFKTLTGKWRLDADRNGYCLEVNKPKGLDHSCFAVFRAPQQRYYFDYDLADGFYAHTWFPAKAE